jgi:hypothetical protein
MVVCPVKNKYIKVRVMVFNATINNISAISVAVKFYWWRKM